jgi:putative Mg2+ transporter-C (MgtC) family protein
LYGGSSPGATLGAIATGVGFLGAGVIMHQHTHIMGLSTAATFWSVAAMVRPVTRSIILWRQA